MKKTDAEPLEGNVIKVPKDHLERDDLRGMALGQTIEYVFADASKLESARSTCNQMRIFGVKFRSRFNLDRTSITITRLK